MIRDKLAAFLYWAAYWLEAAGDRVWYGESESTQWTELALKTAASRRTHRGVTLAEFEELTDDESTRGRGAR